MSYPFERQQRLRDALPEGWSATYNQYTAGFRHRSKLPWVVMAPGQRPRRFGSFDAALKYAETLGKLNSK